AQHRHGGIARRRWDLQDTELPAHERHEVGEGTPRVDADEDWRGPQEPVFALEAAGFSLVLPAGALLSAFLSALLSGFYSPPPAREPPPVELPSRPRPPPRP